MLIKLPIVVGIVPVNWLNEMSLRRLLIFMINPLV